MQWVDTHAHLFLEAFADDIAEVVARAQETGVVRILLPNIDSSSIEPLNSLQAQYPAVMFSAMGLHPTSVKADWEQELKRVQNALYNGNYAAVGEVGLDFYWDTTYARAQAQALELQLEWALELGLPVILHAREAIPDVLDWLEKPRYKTLRAVLHAFNGTIADYRRAMQRPLTWVGIGGIATYKNGLGVPLLEELDLGRVLLETDAPYLSPQGFRGKRNESAHVAVIAQHLGNICRMPLEDVSRLTTQAAYDFFAW